MIKKTLRVLAQLIAVSLLVSCGLTWERPRPMVDPGGETPPEGDLVAHWDQAAAAARINEGSIFVQQAANWSPWRDDIAHAVGDVVTVVVSIDNSAEKSAGTGTKKSSSLQSGITAFFGVENDIPGLGGTADPLLGTTPAQLISAKSASDFDGEGDTKRTGKVTAEISAIVTKVYPNGNLFVEGNQTLSINNETSVISVAGVIRPSDLSFANKIESARIANANIKVSGKGILSEQQTPGFVKRLLDIIWPL